MHVTIRQEFWIWTAINVLFLGAAFILMALMMSEGGLLASVPVVFLVAGLGVIFLARRIRRAQVNA